MFYRRNILLGVTLGLAVFLGLGCHKNSKDQPKEIKPKTYTERQEPPARGKTAPKGRGAAAPKPADGDYSGSVTMAGSSQDQQLEMPQRMVAYSCYYSFETKKFDKAVEEFNNLPESFGGYVVSSDIYKTEDNAWYGKIIMKIPSQKLEQAENRIKAMSGLKLENYNKTSQDVTEEYIDLKVRLANKKRLAERLRKLLDKSYGVSDILYVEQELARVTEEIERMEARMKYLENITSYSQIEVVVHEPYPATTLDNKTGPWRFLKRAAEIGVNLATFVIAGMIVLFIGAVPVIILVLIVWFVIWLFVRRKRQKKT